MANKVDVPNDEKLYFTYTDSDNEKILIQDDSDLKMAYETARFEGNKLKIVIELPQPLKAS